MFKKEESFNGGYQTKDSREIEDLVTDCEDSLQHLKYLEIKEKLLENFIKLASCKTDM